MSIEKTDVPIRKISPEDLEGTVVERAGDFARAIERTGELNRGRDENTLYVIDAD